QQAQHFLPVEYQHVVFTLPAAVADMARRRIESLLNKLRGPVTFPETMRVVPWAPGSVQAAPSPCGLRPLDRCRPAVAVSVALTFGKEYIETKRRRRGGPDRFGANAHFTGTHPCKSLLQQWDLTTGA